MDVDDPHQENRRKRRRGDDQSILFRQVLFTSPFEMVHAAVEEKNQRHRPVALEGHSEKEQSCFETVQDETGDECANQERDRDRKEERANFPQRFLRKDRDSREEKRSQQSWGPHTQIFASCGYTFLKQACQDSMGQILKCVS